MSGLAAALHPMLVHLPIGAWLLAGGAALWPRGEGRQVAFVGLVVGTVAGLAASVTGLMAHEPYEPLGGPLRDAVALHQAFTLPTTFFFFVLTLAVWRARRAGGRPLVRGWVRALVAAGALLVVGAGWSGGRLVFEHGLATPADPLRRGAAGPNARRP